DHDQATAQTDQAHVTGHVMPGKHRAVVGGVEVFDDGQGEQHGGHDKGGKAEDLHVKGVACGLHGVTPGMASRSSTECTSVLNMASSRGPACSPKMSVEAMWASPYWALMIAGTVPNRMTSAAVAIRGMRRARRASRGASSASASFESSASGRAGAFSK